jgi:hypothetical protein
MRDGLVLTLRFLPVDGFRRRKQMRILASSGAIEQPARWRAFDGALAAWGARPACRPVTSGAPLPSVPWRGALNHCGLLRRPAADVARPGCPAGRAHLSRRKTQYKCGNSRVWNNYPLGKPRYDQRLLLAPASRPRWSEMAAETGLSNGAQMLVHSTADGSTTCGHPRDGMAETGSVPNRGPEGMTRTCKNEVMRRTGAEAG